MKPRRLADGPTPVDQATSRPEETEHTKTDTVAAGGRRSEAAHTAKGEGAPGWAAPRHALRLQTASGWR